MCCPYLTLPIHSDAWWLHGLVCSSMSLMRQSTIGVVSCMPEWELLGNISNTCCDNMNSLFTYCCWYYLIVIWCDYWIFMWRHQSITRNTFVQCHMLQMNKVAHVIFDAVLYAMKLVASFFQGTVRTQNKLCWAVLGSNFLSCFCQKLTKSVDIWQRYHKNN